MPVVQAVEEKSAEELERIAEKKRESGRRLQEQVQKQRLEKVSRCRFGRDECTADDSVGPQMVRQEEELIAFAELKASKGTGRKADYEVRRALDHCSRLS